MVGGRNSSTFSVHVNVILNLQKRCASHQRKTFFAVDFSINWATNRH